MVYGYTGKILRVDLSSGRISEVPTASWDLRAFIGGSGLGARILFDEVSPGADPLDPENLLMFLTGPLAGTPAPTSGRHAVVAKSPATGAWGESDVGGTWGHTLKLAGYDGVIFEGGAPGPVYLWITREGAELRPAGHLWGRDSFETDALVKAETAPGAAVTAIGPAGENLVLFASIMSDGRHARAAGRGGLGAVMGSKKLKAIAVLGDREPSIARRAELMASIREIAPTISQKAQGLRAQGTARGVTGAEALGDLPIKNWSQGAWKGAENLSGDAMAEKILTGRYACARCFIGCGREVKVDSGPYAGVESGGPEYETLASFGSLCLVDDLEAVAYANELSNRLGLDTISAGSAIAFAIEASQRGLIPVSETGGRRLAWGDPVVVVDLLRQIAARRGLGDLLAGGVRKAASAIGGGSEDYAIEVKGVEFPMHDPRALHSLAVAYATSNRGACHRQAFSHGLEARMSLPELGYDQPLDRFADLGKGTMTAKMQNLMELFGSLKLCGFLLSNGLKPRYLAGWLNHVTGWDFDLPELLRAGERSFNLKRVYNVRCGLSARDDRLPARILREPNSEGGAAGSLPRLNVMLQEYYEYRGWDSEGVPTPARLRELGLDAEARMIEERVGNARERASTGTG